MAIERLPLQLFGLEDIPAVPVQLEAMLDTVVRLGGRSLEVKPAVQGLTTEYTLGGTTASAYEFLYGAQSSQLLSGALDGLASLLKANPDRVRTALSQELAEGALKNLGRSQAGADPNALTSLSLEQPRQWSISTTTYADLYRQLVTNPDFERWTASLTDPAQASAQFWPTIALYSLGYNLLILQKATPANAGGLKARLGAAWTAEMDSWVSAGGLYFIDLAIFASVAAATVDGFPRFTPSTLTLLRQDPQTKDLTPVAVLVAGQDGAGAQVYFPASAAWLYALQAAKASITVYGIWLGHVYHFHVVTAAMQMTMYNSLPSSHPIYQLVAPQSQYLIPFDDVLLLLWDQIAPPTSISSAFQFLQLTNLFAKGRSYFDDDPIGTLERNGIQEADFTSGSGPAWDKYPVVAQYLTIWEATQEYVQAFVAATYESDAAVAGDTALQAWIAAASDPRQGNVRGLPAMNGREALQRVLTSLLYRITMHGAARLLSATHPALAFVANYPPCLQDAAIPAPDTVMTTPQLFAYLPKTGTIGKMMTFYYIFCFSQPYEPFVPWEGVESSPFFPGGPADPRNAALARFRLAVESFIAGFSPQSPPRLVQTYQWPLNIET